MKRTIRNVIIILACILDLVIGGVQYHRFRMTYGEEAFAKGWIGSVLCLGPYVVIFIGGMISLFLLQRDNK